MERSIKHKHLKKSQLWRREGKWENSVKGGEKSYSTLLWRMSGEDSKIGGEIGKRGKHKRGNNFLVRLWRMTREESKLGGRKTGNG